MYDYDNLESLCHRCHVEAHVELKSKSKEKTQQRNAEVTQSAISRYFKRPPGGVFLEGEGVS